MTKHLTTIMLALALCGASRAADWYVPDDGALQAVITGAASNDTVWVSNGTYITNITIGTGVTVRSTSGIPTDVILDGNANGVFTTRVVNMVSSSWLIGCTVTNGGGIYGGSASRCKIVGNTAIDFGAGGRDCNFYSCFFIAVIYIKLRCNH